MPLFSPSALNDGVRQREVLGWALYDFANSGYTTVVLTAVFNAYFVGVVAGDASWATLAWTSALALANALVMLTMPPLGAWADRHAAKKRLLMLSTLGCVGATLALATVGPGDLVVAMIAIVVSNLCFSYGETLVAAFLPELARRDHLGTVSGWGWSIGYLGGMLTLGLSLAWVLWAQGQGQPAERFVPVTMLITAGVYAVASLATFAWLRERAVPQRSSQADPAGGLGAMFAVWRGTRAHRDFRGLLACAVAYQAGIAVVIALAAVYAEQVLGFTQTQTMALIFVVNIASAVGAFAWGYVQDRIGHRQALGATLLAWVVMVVLAWAATGPGLFWVAATIGGLCMGSSQSAGRALAGLLAPGARLAEFYGLWAFATRLASIIGPLTYGLITWATGGDHRTAILGTGAFFVVGWLLLQRVDVDRGRRDAG